MLRHQYLVGPLGCRHLVGTAEFNPISREMPGTLRFRYLTGAAAFFFFFFFFYSYPCCCCWISFSVSKSPAFSGEKRVLQEDGGQITHQRASHAAQCCIQGIKGQNEREKPLPTGWRNIWVGPSKEESVKNEKRQNRRTKSGLWGQRGCWACTDCWDDTIPLQFGATGTHLKKSSLDYQLKKLSWLTLPNDWPYLGYEPSMLLML